ncbi:MAG TPA: hypothetical protein DD643_00910 [Synechococcus sp. UBA8638]|nr:hypothetical protein [Synechococcus sp. UBA8638]
MRAVSRLSPGRAGVAFSWTPARPSKLKTNNLAKAQGILKLYDAMKEQVISLTHSRYAIPALDWIFRWPIFKSTDFVKQTGIPAPTARRILKCLRDSKICTTMMAARGRRAALLVFPQLLAITEENRML